MAMEVHDFIQGSPEWLNARIGLLTASNFKMIMTPTGRPAKNDKVRAVVYDLAAQRINGFRDEIRVTADMERGKQQEIIARDYYNQNFAPATEIGFVTNEVGGVKVGASPDGIVGTDGGIEIKSRLGKFQIKTIIEDTVPAEYMAQIQGCMMVCEREWWDFVQYSNAMELYVKRVLPDEEYQSNLTEAIQSFEESVQQVTTTYRDNAKPFVPTEFHELDDDAELEDF